LIIKGFLVLTVDDEDFTDESSFETARNDEKLIKINDESTIKLDQFSVFIL